MTPEAVIKLSDVLRYVIYDAETSFICLNDELNFIKKYINLQQLRLDDSILVEMKTEGNLGNQKIAPLIFLPFVENAFKYAPQSKGKKKYINILWKIDGQDVFFKIENSFGELAVKEDEKYSGVGVENVIKRLEIIYPEKHILEINTREGKYKVELKMQLS